MVKIQTGTIWHRVTCLRFLRAGRGRCVNKVGETHAEKTEIGISLDKIKRGRQSDLVRNVAEKRETESEGFVIKR